MIWRQDTVLNERGRGAQREPGEVSSVPRGHSPQPVFLPPSFLQVEMGPFKHTVDDGLDVRKAAFECMYSLLESCLGQLDVCEFLNHVEDGLKDHYDIRVGGAPAGHCPSAPTPACHPHKSSRFVLLSFWLHSMACGILVPQSGIRPMPTPCTGRPSRNHWATREVPRFVLFQEEKEPSSHAFGGSGQGLGRLVWPELQK